MSCTRNSQFLAASALSLILIACGSSSPEAAERPRPAASGSVPAAERLQRLRASALPTGDCPLLSEAALRARFPNVAAELESRVRTTPYPSCTYVWVTRAKDKRTFGGQVVEVPGEGRVSVTLAAVRAPEPDWQRVLSSYRIEPPEAVDGIGDKAVWSDQRHQLSVLVPNWVLHVAVEDNDAPGTGREQALAIARDILKDLK